MLDSCSRFGNSHVLSPISRSHFCKILVQDILDDHIQPMNIILSVGA